MGEFIGTLFIGAVVVLAVALLYTIPIYYLWNWLMPIIFGLTKITFWQALGLSMLSSFLIKPSSSSSK